MIDLCICTFLITMRKHNIVVILNISSITFPYFEKSCFKSVALVIDDKPLTQMLRTKDELFFFAKTHLKK